MGYGSILVSPSLSYLMLIARTSSMALWKLTYVILEWRRIDRVEFGRGEIFSSKSRLWDTCTSIYLFGKIMTLMKKEERLVKSTYTGMPDSMLRHEYQVSLKLFVLGRNWAEISQAAFWTATKRKVWQSYMNNSALPCSWLIVHRSASRKTSKNQPCFRISIWNTVARTGLGGGTNVRQYIKLDSGCYSIDHVHVQRLSHELLDVS